MRPISRIAKQGAKVAVLLPVVVRDSSETEDPVYAMDMDVVDWEAGVEVKGVRTHFYAEVCILRCIAFTRVALTLIRMSSTSII